MSRHLINSYFFICKQLLNAKCLARSHIIVITGNQCTISFVYNLQSLLLLQAELDSFVGIWNNHYIRKSNYTLAYGRPSLMYELPEMYETEECLIAADLNKLEICIDSDLYVKKPNIPCQDEDMFELCLEEMVANNLNVANNSTEARTLYNVLRPIIRNRIGLP